MVLHTVLLLTTMTPPAQGLLFVSSRWHQNQNQTSRPICSQDTPGTNGAEVAAMALNSVTFLAELCSVKNTADITYYKVPISDRRRQSNSMGKDPSKQTLGSFLSRIVGGGEPGDRVVGTERVEKRRRKVEIKHETACEYTGTLWFLGSRGVKFRETVRVVDVSKDGTSALVECDTAYRRGESWIDCSRVTCQLMSSSSSYIDVKMQVDSQVLVKIPLPGPAGRALRKKIGSVFELAAMSFLQKLNSNTSPEYS
uniref:Uncharacterized protein n=1 Tax=Attheya septentrionalis TaxID=420275 RepID=A0A7S2XRR8_9STRA